MVPPVQVSPLIKFGRYSALILGMAYGAKRYSEFGDPEGGILGERHLAV